ncbi:MAG TPA: tetratricopeptide repeat protein [Streptosporangiaceae bacterium]|nr:tetratricopeptide repeat protein [Streptosporangiaceae bacterium]
MLGFAGLLRQLRAEAGLTQEELAEAAGLGVRTVSDLERGAHRSAHQDTARLLAGALGLAGSARGLFVAAARGRAAAADVLVARGDDRVVPVSVVTGSLPVPAAANEVAGLVPRQLPSGVESFTGRAVELAELDFLLPAARQESGAAPGPVVIAAVAGTGGVGKTALVVRWAHRVAGQFPDGQLFLNLQGYDPGEPVAPGQALAGFLRTLGVRDADIPLEEAERAARYRSLLSAKRVLVVLDNAASEEQVRPLLPGTGMAMVVVTSRDSLPGLVARDGAHRLDLGLLPLEEAVTLLRTLVGARADTEPAAAEALASLCARLPLALRIAAELAISRPHTPLAVLAAELADEDSRLQLLDAGGDPRAALASVFSWSYRRLPPDAAQLFRLLGLHPGADWDQYAAAALTSTSIAWAGRLVAVLARAHLVQPTGPGRYGMHNLLRAYAAGLAASRDGEPATRAALTGLFDYYLSACAAAMDCLVPAEREYRPSPPAVSIPVPRLDNRAAARAWLGAELATLTVVAAHTASHGWPSHTTRLAATLFRYLRNGYSIEGLAICGYALSAARSQGDLTGQTFMLAALGRFHLRQGRHQQAADLNRQAIALARDTGDRAGEAQALLNLGNCYAAQVRYPQAARCYRRALALSRTPGDQVAEARALCMVGTVYYLQGRYAHAADYLEQALAVSGQTSNFQTESSVLLRLGEVCHRQGRYQQATHYLKRAISLSRELGMRGREGTALVSLGQVCHRQGHYDQATAYYQQALAPFRDSGDLFSEAEALNGMGQTLLVTGQPDQARSCHSTALRIGDYLEQARALGGLGQVSYWQGHHEQATGYHQQALTVYQEIGDPAGQADAANSLGQALLVTGHPEQARSCHTTALTLARRIGDRYQQARAYHGLAAVCQATADAGRAGRHWRRALEIYTGLGVPDASHAPFGPDHLAAENSASSS